jgi:hypothetical protein
MANKSILPHRKYPGASGLKYDADICLIIYDQLPRALQGKFRLSIRHDAFHFRTEATFREIATDKESTCVLERKEIEGVPVSCKIPDQFLAMLCLTT